MKNPIKILVFPKDENPYQGLLYFPLRKKGIEIKYAFPACNSRILSLLFLVPAVFYYKSKGYKLFHLHWTSGFSSPIAFLRPFYSAYFLFLLRYLKFLNYRLIWTVHNLMPHERLFVDDLKYRRILSNLADAKIVHSNSVIEEMDALGIDTENTHVIPIGSYNNLYENKVSRGEARKKLKLRSKDFVFLFFGNVRRYKGIEDLLKAFNQLSKGNKNVKLILAGECNDSSLLECIKSYGEVLKNKLIGHIHHIPDKDIQHYFNSADVAVFPFKKVTTSSSVILALSFARPIVCPEIGCLKNLPKNIGFSYNPQEKNSLFKSMKKARSNRDRLNSLGKNAEIYSKTLSWDKIAEKTLDLYRRLIE